MAVNNNFYETINDLVAQSMGSEAIDVVDYASFVEAGKTILADTGTINGLANNWVAALLNKIALSIDTFRGYTGKFTELNRGQIGYGNTIEMIMYHFYDTVAAGFTALTEGESVDQYVVYKPDIEAFYYTDSNAYAIPITIKRDQLKKAFSSPESMDKFISGIMGSVINSNEKTRERGRAGMLAKAVDESAANEGAKVVDDAWIGQPGTCYKLVTMYNETYEPETDLTADTALQDPNFIAFAVEVINSVLGTVGEASTEFNVAGIESFSRPEDRTLYVASQFAAKAKRVYSNTYNPEYNMLAEFKPVGAWQNLNDPLSIEVEGGESDDRTYKCLACIADFYSVGEYVVSQEMDVTPYNARGKYWNNFLNVEVRYLINLGANFVSFLLA